MDLNKWIHDRNNCWSGTPTIIPGVDRPNLALWFNEWGFKEGVEVGTYRGQFAEVLLKSNPNLHLTCVDPWTPYEGYNEHQGKFRAMNKYYEDAKARLKPYNCTLMREYSALAAEQIEDESLDFVYIDGNHTLPYVIQDLYSWEPKIKKGGVLCGHDYLRFDWLTGLQVVEAVNAYMSANRIKQWYVLGRPRPYTKDPHKLNKYARSWMWVKE